MKGLKVVSQHKHKLLWLLPIMVALAWISLNKISVVRGDVILFVEPMEGTFKVGDEIEVAVKVRADRDINAVEAKLKVVEKEAVLEVVDIRKSDSLIPLWISEPTFLKEERVIDFSGIVPDPGFKGEGKIVSIKLKAKTPGEILIDIHSAAVLANDGKGTDVLEKKIGAKYLIIDNVAPSSDFNNDGKNSIADVSILISAWGKTGIENTHYDLNRDGRVGLGDLSILLSKIVAK